MTSGQVAPFMGAWIEISYEADMENLQDVAPFMGAWIEIKETSVSSVMNVVAPFMGAWIEIGRTMACFPCPMLSHPSWVRGLKLPIGRKCEGIMEVAPFMGAWIEIPPGDNMYTNNKVAPFMGAWIEICTYDSNNLLTDMSHPSWVRGLKLIS